MIGRERETTETTRLLRREGTRLLTLTGPGGVGKTRLAVEVAWRLRESFEGGAAFVSLAPLRDPTLILSAIAGNLGVREEIGRTLRETLRHHLRDGRTLLVLDNFEHLLAAAPEIAGLLEDCPGLKALATSRAPLHIRGERQIPVSPLSLPDTGPSLAEDAVRTPAVELFRQRAGAAVPAFALDATNVEVVARICRKLDGLPLAIELAATRIKLFSPKALLARLDSGLYMLSGGARDLPERQRTLRDAIAWSYELLDAGERALFHRLSVFAGGCTLEAAEAVCGADPPEKADVLDGLTTLVDNSLLVPLSGIAPQDEPRFTMLETIREYALERLKSSGEAGEIGRKHARYFLALVEAMQPELSPGQEGEWLSDLEVEHDNLRAALRWSIENREAEIGGRLVLALWRLWVEHGHCNEGRRWAEEVLALDGSEADAARAASRLPAHKRAFLVHVAGILTATQGDYDGATALYEESLAAYRRLDYKKGMSGSLRELGVMAFCRGDYERAVRMNEQALALAREFNTAFGVAYTLFTLADAVLAQGDKGRATTLLEESLALFRSLEHTWGVSQTLTRLGNMACEAAEDGQASKLYGESLELVRQWGYSSYAAVSLEGLARVAAMRDHPARAALLCAAAEAVREEVGVPLSASAHSPTTRAESDRTISAARVALGEDAFEAAWAEGRDMTLEQAAAYALGGTTGDASGETG